MIKVRKRCKTKCDEEDDDGEGLIEPGTQPAPEVHSEDIACRSCGQVYGCIEKDSAHSQTLKWHKTNTLKSGVVKPCGAECYPCFAVRRRDYKGVGQQDLLKMKADSEANDVFHQRRRAYVRGCKGKKLDLATSSTTTVLQAKGNFTEEFSEGYFYPLKEYVKGLLPGHDSSKWSDKDCFQYMQQSHPDVQVVKDRFGMIGVKEQNLPTGARYKYRDGAFGKDTFQQCFTFDEEDDDDTAADAFNEMVDDSKDITEYQYSDHDVCQMSSSNVVTPSAASGDPPKRFQMHGQRHGSESSITMQAGNITMDSPIKVAPKQHVLSPVCKESAEASMATQLALSDCSTELTGGDGNAGEGHQGVSFSKMAAALRALCPAKAITAAKSILEMAKNRYPPTKLWEQDGHVKKHRTHGEDSKCCSHTMLTLGCWHWR